MANDCHILSDRLSAFLGRKYPGLGRDKLLARDIHVSPRTARNYLEGFWPGARAWRSIVREFGSDVIEAVFIPEIDEVRALDAAEVRALEEALATKRAAIRARRTTHAYWTEDVGTDH